MTNSSVFVINRVKAAFYPPRSVLSLLMSSDASSVDICNYVSFEVELSSGDVGLIYSCPGSGVSNGRAVALRRV